ncbi:MAG: DUF6691 family protein [Alphaproteobacteria bacterium]|nr:DUF6691 family protein [Alphaproteobacteria bacterium]
MAFLAYGVAGVMFGLGLILAGMTDPAKVLNFLDVLAIPAGTWDPSLALVLGGATGTTLVGYRLVLARTAPLFAPRFDLPGTQKLDARLIIGSGLFGIGWALAGLCPGPAIVGMALGAPGVLLFVPAMLVGMVAARLTTNALDRRVQRTFKPA